MKVKIQQLSSAVLTFTKNKAAPIQDFVLRFKKYHPKRFYSVVFAVSFITLTIFYRLIIQGLMLDGGVETFLSNEESRSAGNSVHIEKELKVNNDENILGAYAQMRDLKTRSDVGFVDVRVLALEEFFRSYDSKLDEYSDDFIEATERYEVDNWQLLPAIAMAETSGCQTGISYEQRNCWGWGGSGSNRWEFNSFEQAIDLITYRMKRGYGNERLNAKDIQSTYCGQTCMEWGWKWARGVNYYVVKLNDIGERYGIPRTNEIEDWS